MNSRNHARSSPGGRLPSPTHEQIAALAHELWLERGCPEGSDIDIWLEAERQLRGMPPGQLERDPIPADPDRIDPDVDPALNPEEDREIGRFAGRPNPRSPTDYDV